VLFHRQDVFVGLVEIELPDDGLVVVGGRDADLAWRGPVAGPTSSVSKRPSPSVSSHLPIDSR
jgi:hypothetical protein